MTATFRVVVGAPMDPELTSLDLTGAQHVEVQFDDKPQGRVVRVNVDGIMRLRVCSVSGFPGIAVTDDRPQQNLAYAVDCVQKAHDRIQSYLLALQGTEYGPAAKVHADDLADLLNDAGTAIRDFRGEER